MQLDVEIEDRQSWPPGFMKEVEQNRSLILSYQRERSRIDRLGYDDVLVRINRPENKYTDKFFDLVERLESLLIPHRLVAYHCTRLTPEEIQGVKKVGLRLLSPALVKEKLDACYSGGYISRKDFEYLERSKSVADNLNDVHASRSNMIWFCPNRSTLKESSGVYRHFRSWGGEAIYCGHEEDNDIAHVLSSVGVACIVKCAIPFKRLEQFYANFAERFMSQYISDEMDYPEPSAEFDLLTRQDLMTSDVLEVIEHPDPRFEALTNYASWPAFHQIKTSAG